MHRSYLMYLVLCIILVFFIPVSGQADTAAGGNTGIYRFHGNVEGAQVFVDGLLKGVIEDGILDVPVNVTGAPYHTYTFQKEGYETYNGTMYTIPAKGQVISIYVPMSAKPVVEYSRVHLLISPPLAEVTWDGVSAGTVDSTGIMILYDVVPGTHTLMVTKEGYATLNEAIYVPANDDTKVQRSLQPVLLGSISVESVPAGASVSLDGKVVGVTPLILNDIAVGAHSIIISGEGFQDVISAIDVTGGGTTVVSEALLPATPAAGITSAGFPPMVMAAGLAIAALFLAYRKP